ncbi:MAG: DUF4386 domain-containing protein [Thermomicrobiales bacterium]|nr:DUF4386 domain-containing protein [Thermomicrobiales bacterium]MCO5226059.1 DUF4386 domain-containing protein [Thermomicrobiales bacterium]MCO5227192.1 DUF4386 domain-containing protein [Thermomicrobiales bacterium]
MSASLRIPSLIAGISLLLMAILSPLGLLLALPRGQFEIAAMTVLVVSALDVIAAVALFYLFRGSEPIFAAIAAALRIAYGAVFVAAAGFLMAPVDEARFHAFWELGLFFIGLHLVFVGFAVLRTIPKWIGVLVIVSGIGYALDAVSQVLRPENPLTLTEFAFVGEVILLVWCLGWGGRDRADQHRLAEA